MKNWSNPVLYSSRFVPVSIVLHIYLTSGNVSGGSVTMGAGHPERQSLYYFRVSVSQSGDAPHSKRQPRASIPTASCAAVRRGSNLPVRCQADNCPD